MPSQSLDRFIEPSRVESPVGHHDHLPIRRHHSFERCEQSFPMRTPCSFLPCLNDFPCDAYPTSPIHHADIEHREPLSQRHSIYRQGQFLFPLPTPQNTAQQIGKTALHIHLSPFLASLSFCLVVKFSQSLSQSLCWNLFDFG